MFFCGQEEGHNQPKTSGRIRTSSQKFAEFPEGGWLRLRGILVRDVRQEAGIDGAPKMGKQSVSWNIPAAEIRKNAPEETEK